MLNGADEDSVESEGQLAGMGVSVSQVFSLCGRVPPEGVTVTMRGQDEGRGHNREFCDVEKQFSAPPEPLSLVVQVGGRGWLEDERQVEVGGVMSEEVVATGSI